MANIQDVAKLAGHSVSTVSRTLNNSGYIAAKTRQEVMTAIRALDYHRNGIARALSLGKTNQIGIVVPYINHPYFQKLTDAITEMAFYQDYQVTLLATNYVPEQELHYLDLLKHHLLDGLIFTSRSLPFEEIARFKDYGPIVCCEDTFDFPITSVFTNRSESFLDVFRRLKRLNLTHIGVTVSRNERVSQSAQAMIKAYAMVFGQALEDKMIFRESKNTFDGLTAARTFVKNEPQLQAIFANGDEIAAGALRQLQQLGSSALVIGQENLPVSFLMDYSTIDHGLIEMGQTAFGLLFKNHLVKQQVASKLIMRGTLQLLESQRINQNRVLCSD
ncbi:LacI family DNA-binding transcriptional regulator [Lactiplantibacillus garii]|uniref:LacI family DNA-binding transcriptional regulator n=1 Tax=Lactiplantibacillus garii TaxID=2306423 RepID=A0A426D683_9LACO|nr:LacI family DNA-binding transcriptional regulator [Lactiplantibacillus garii]RRK10088.1 LacI family DNA-binding transcriptional regulator [Lactiplantibacillus garii]